MATAPDFLLRYLRDMDKMESYSPYIPAPEERAQLVRYLGLLPGGYQETLRQCLVAIYYVKNLIGSGMADYVLDDKKGIYAILIINPETMRHTMSEWMTYRERTAFSHHSAGQPQVLVDCGTEYTGMMYLLLHEASHIMDYEHHYTPYVEDDLRRLGLSTGETFFTKGVWTAYDSPVREYAFKGRDAIHFYGLGGGEPISIARAPEMYAALSASPFASLYGSRDWAEDFAELATWSFYTASLHQPYRIILSVSEGPEVTIEPMKTRLVQKRAGALLAERREG